nr:MAG TPA: hypothetical protein [Caudoviricetes sp.]
MTVKHLSFNRQAYKSGLTKPLKQVCQAVMQIHKNAAAFQ